MSGRTFECYLCKIIIKSKKWNLLRHFELMHTSPDYFVCPNTQCRATFKTRYNLKSYYQVIHGKKQRSRAIWWNRGKKRSLNVTYETPPIPLAPVDNMMPDRSNTPLDNDIEIVIPRFSPPPRYETLSPPVLHLPNDNLIPLAENADVLPFLWLITTRNKISMWFVWQNICV